MAIVGAGIAGLTLALCLSRVGIASVVAERAARLEPVGAGIQLSPNAGHVIAALGLAAAIDRAATRPRRLTIVSGVSGRTIAAVPYDGAEARYGAPYRLIHRGDLQQVLLDAARDDPRIEIRLGTAVTAIAAAGERVRAAVGDAALETPLAIGADGVGSAVRAAVRADPAPRATGLDAWRATVPATGANPASETMLALSPGSHIVRYPVAGGTLVNFVAILPAAPGRSDAAAGPGLADAAARSGNPDDDAAAPGRPEAARGAAAAFLDASGRDTTLDALRAALARHAWCDELARAGDGWRRWPLLAVASEPPWSNGRVALIGDAAHAMLPFMAQGGAMAIEDAAVLAAMIARHGAGPPALAAYASARRPRVARVARASARTGRIYHLSPPLALARDAAMRALGPHRLLSRLDWLYGWRPPPLG